MTKSERAKIKLLIYEIGYDRGFNGYPYELEILQEWSEFDYDYSCGYERGVADYCRQHHKDEHEQYLQGEQHA